jgi:hypothetical protein
MRLATKSERLFEEFCKLHNLIPIRIPESSERQPDYEVSFNGQRVIFEIKQIEPNEADREHNTALEKKRWATRSRDPDRVAERIRNGIDEGRGQIRSYLKNNPSLPAIIVFYDNANNRYTDPYVIKVAMHGWEQVTFSVPTNGQSPQVIERGFGKRNNKAMRPDQNEQISAIATLHEFRHFETKERGLALCFYHNNYAAYRFDPLWWQGNNIIHCIIGDKARAEFQNWERL